MVFILIVSILLFLMHFNMGILEKSLKNILQSIWKMEDIQNKTAKFCQGLHVTTCNCKCLMKGTVIKGIFFNSMPIRQGTVIKGIVISSNYLSDKVQLLKVYILTVNTY